MHEVEDAVGRQLDGDELVQRQGDQRLHSVAGPTVLAVGLRTPENVGSLLRLADAAGCAEVVVVVSASLNDKNIRKTARNCHQLVKWRFASEEDALSHVTSVGHPVVALEMTTCSRSIFDATLKGPCTLVVGGEREGIPPHVLKRCHAAVHIPMFGVNGSMNVTHALAVALFEWRRQNS